VGAFYDAVLLYAQAVNETLRDGLDPSNGSDVTRRMWNRTFTGNRRHVYKPVWSLVPRLST